MAKKTIMVLDGSSRAALAIVRSMGKRGFTVIVGGNKSSARALCSRYCTHSFVYDEQHHAVEQTHKQILTAIKEWRPDVLMPLFSFTTALCIRYAHEYTRYTRLIPLPTGEQFENVDDKNVFDKTIKQLGFTAPHTYEVEEDSDLKPKAHDIVYPVLIKPRKSAGGFGIRRADNAHEFIDNYKAVQSMPAGSAELEPFDGTDPVVQQYVDGEQFTIHASALSGEVTALYIAQSIRRYPIPYGASIAYKSIHDNEIKDFTCRLLKALNWHGAINILIIRDKTDKTLKLIEANPRMAGTIEGAIASGIDIPYLLYQQVNGDEETKFMAYSANNYFRWVCFGEFLFLRDTNDALRVLRDLLTLKNTRCDIDIKDIAPHIQHFKNLIKNREEVR